MFDELLIKGKKNDFPLLLVGIIMIFNLCFSVFQIDSCGHMDWLACVCMVHVFKFICEKYNINVLSMYLETYLYALRKDVQLIQ